MTTVVVLFSLWAVGFIVSLVGLMRWSAQKVASGEVSRSENNCLCLFVAFLWPVMVPFVLIMAYEYCSLEPKANKMREHS